MKMILGGAGASLLLLYGRFSGNDGRFSCPLFTFGGGDTGACGMDGG
jgi:hypothetical protein